MSASAQVVRTRRSVTMPALSLTIGLVAAAAGLILAASIVKIFLALGGDAPYVTHLMALNAPVSSEVGEAFGAAASSVDNLSYVIAVVGSAGAAILLIVGAGFWLTSARAKHPEASRRVSAAGFWLAMAVGIFALLPIEGTWKDVGLAGADDGSSGLAVQLVLLSILGLLLLQVVSPFWTAGLEQSGADDREAISALSK